MDNIICILSFQLNEPNGLHFIENPQDESSLLLIADTNNHAIWIYNFDTYIIKKVNYIYYLANLLLMFTYICFKN